MLAKSKSELQLLGHMPTSNWIVVKDGVVEEFAAVDCSCRCGCGCRPLVLDDKDEDVDDMIIIRVS